MNSLKLLAERPAVLGVAVPAPLPYTLDYLLPMSGNRFPHIGARVRVSLGRRQVIGLIIEHKRHSKHEKKQLKPVYEVIDDAPILDSNTLELLCWTSQYYQHPIGEVITTALPAHIRKGNPLNPRGRQVWLCTQDGLDTCLEKLSRRPKQAALLTLLKQHPEGLDAEHWNRLTNHWRQPLKILEANGLVTSNALPCLETQACEQIQIELNTQQKAAANEVCGKLDRFSAYLLNGITGSGKTEVYIEIIQHVLERHRQALLLVPEIGLTPQLLQRFQQRLTVPIAVMHSGLTDQQRHCAWHMARTGQASVIIGTRSAVFTPLAHPGVIIIDEEHDASFKQQEGVRYHGRDVAVYRARQIDIPVVLGSATPSLESLHNINQQKYAALSLSKRAGAASLPALSIIDVRRRLVQHGISDILRAEIHSHLQAKEQVLVFLNRRGFAPALVCHACGWIAPCQRCDAYLTLHATIRKLRCHHCGFEQGAPTKCASCGNHKLQPTGAGTERVEQALQQWFPEASIVRIDRDTTRRKGTMQTKLNEIKRGEHQILIGTQMLSKGHHFPKVTLVGILDIDQGLFSTDFRATERMAQEIVQVAGRAGRATRPGKVLLQTHRPDHPLLNTLLTQGYTPFCEAVLHEREAAQLPPFTFMAVLRTESQQRETALEFLESIRHATNLKINHDIQLMGPIPAPMERRAGRYRAQLLVTAKRRQKLKAILAQWVTLLKGSSGARRVRWSLDVDPIDLY